MELKNISKDSTSFEANGKKYIIESSLSIERYRAFQKMEIEFAYDVGFLTVFENLNKSIDCLNKQKWVEAAVLLSNTRDSIKSLEKKRLPAMDMCALFMNTESEDRRWITNEMLLTKQNDWETEGIPSDFFLVIAQNLVRGYRENLKLEALTSLAENQSSEVTG